MLVSGKPPRSWQKTAARGWPYVFVDYTRVDSGLNKTAPFLGTLCGVDRIDNWAGLGAEEKRARKERWMDRLIADLDREFPGFASTVVHREMATAETMQHYLNSRTAPSMALHPRRSALRRAPRSQDSGSPQPSPFGWIHERHGWRRSGGARGTARVRGRVIVEV